MEGRCFFAISIFHIIAILHLSCQDSAAKAIADGEENSSFSAKNPSLPPSSVEVKVENLFESEGSGESQEWIIFSITDDTGVVGVKLEQDQRLTIPRHVFCQLWRDALLDDIVSYGDHYFLMPPQHPAAGLIKKNQVTSQKQAPVVQMGQNKLLSTWLMVSEKR